MLLHQARAAETIGAATLWMASHVFQRDPFSSAAQLLATTERPRVALMAVSPYVIHPVLAAMAAATLDEWYPGRVVLCFGTGAPADLAAVGLAARSPLATLREALDVARLLLSGHRVRYAGRVFRVYDRGLPTGRRQVRLFLAASGPKVLELAGAVADGVLLSAGTSPEFVRWALAHVERGARGRPVERVGLVYAALASPGTRALDRIRRTLAVTLCGDHHRFNVHVTGTSVDQAALADAVRREDWTAVSALVTDETVRRHTASGSVDEVRTQLRRYWDAGLDEVVLAGLREPDEIRRLAAAVGAEREER